MYTFHCLPDTVDPRGVFWTSNRLKTHVELRNEIAHQGRFATPAEAQASIDVAREVISYLTAVAAAQSIDLSA